MLYEEAVGYLEGLFAEFDDADFPLDGEKVAEKFANRPSERTQDACVAVQAACDECGSTDYRECACVLLNAGVRAGIIELVEYGVTVN